MTKTMEDAMMRSLVVANGCTEQNKCSGCGALLESWTRTSHPVTGEIWGPDPRQWSCATCAVPGATVANVAEAWS